MCCLLERLCTVWRSEGNLVESVLSFHHYESSRERAQVTRFAQQSPLSTEPSHQAYSFFNVIFIFGNDDCFYSESIEF